MANEITITSSLSLNRTSAPTYAANKSGSIQVDQAGEGFTFSSQTIGTSEENLAKSADITTIGLVWLKNLDATNFITMGSTTGQLPVKVNPGEICGPVRFDATNVIAKADTANVKVEFLLIED